MNNQENEAEEEEDVPAKKKTKGPSDEEVAQDKVIVNLQVLYRCEDRKCSYDFCWLAGSNTTHIHLTHLHLRTWAAALAAKEEGVDMESPPNVKIFDVTYSGNLMDTNLLAKRRVALQAHGQNSPTVNFEGLANVIKQLNPAYGRENAPPAPAPLAAVPLHRRPPPKMSIATFCSQFDLSPEIQAKLLGIAIAGPHLLRLVDDGALRGEAGLSLGELAGIRDAEERWMNEVSM